MSHEQYLDEPGDVIEWALRISEIRGDLPWVPKKGGPGADPGAP